MTSDWAYDLFPRIAVPRLPGSRAVSQVEAIVTEQLRAFGYEVRHQIFQTAPDRLRGAAVGGAGLGCCALVLFPPFVLPFPGWGVALAGTALLAIVGLLAAGVAMRLVWADHSVVAATNVFGTSGSAPRFWLVAHSDSKGQRLSLRGRVMASMSLGLGAGGLVVLLALRVAGPLPVAAVAPWVLLTLVGGAAMAGPVLAGSSPGAVDNASGIIAALVAAQQLKNRSDIGVLITAAEEFGMEGARRWTQLDVASGSFVNFDGIDRIGVVNVMTHSPKTGATREPDREAAIRLRISVSERLAEAGYAVRRSRLPLGVFVDGSVLAGGGLGGITVSRGNWTTLGVVHTARDTVERTDPKTAIDMGRIVAQAVAALLG